MNLIKYLMNYFFSKAFTFVCGRLVVAVVLDPFLKSMVVMMINPSPNTAICVCNRTINPTKKRKKTEHKN